MLVIFLSNTGNKKYKSINAVALFLLLLLLFFKRVHILLVVLLFSSSSSLFPLVMQGSSPSTSSSPTASPSFDQLGVEGWLCHQCSSLAMHYPTPIQSKCIPPILAGSHVLGGAVTGSGKTAAFALPMLQLLSKDMFGVFGLVLTPSRELAYQLTDQFIALGAPIRLRSVLLIGGVSHNEQVAALQTRPHFLFATPGRLCFLFRTFEKEVSSSLRYLRFLVLDEADRLTEGELGNDVHWLLSEHLTPTPLRQVLLFSATLHTRFLFPEKKKNESVKQNHKQGKRLLSASALEKGAAKDEDGESVSWLPLLGIQATDRYEVLQVGNEAVVVPSASEATTQEETHHTLRTGGTLSARKEKRKREEDESGTEMEGEKRNVPSASAEDLTRFHLPKGLFNGFLFIPNMVKLPYLVATLRSLGKSQMTIVFANSCVRTELVHLVLQLLGFPVCRLHSLLRQQQRLDSLAMFKLGLAKIMVATDIASRGLDIPEVEVVVHYDIPKEAAPFVHRVGRTARAGREGLSIALITECDVRSIKQIEKKIGSQLTAWTKSKREPKTADMEDEMGVKGKEKGKKKKKEKKKGTLESRSGDKDQVHDSTPDAPAIEEEAVVNILDEVSAAKVTALQQVKETLGNRAETLKEQAAASKERKKEEKRRRESVGKK